MVAWCSREAGRDGGGARVGCSAAIQRTQDKQNSTVRLSFYGVKTTWDARQGRRRSGRGLRGGAESGSGGSVRAGHAREEGDDAADMSDRLFNVTGSGRGTARARCWATCWAAAEKQRPCGRS